MTYLLLTCITFLGLAVVVLRLAQSRRLKLAQQQFYSGLDDQPPQFQLRSGQGDSGLPANAIPIKARQYFFSPAESSFYAELVAALAGSSYRIFPDVRLDQIFQGTDLAPDAQTAASLRQQTVDFLVLELPEFRPLLGLSLTHQPQSVRRSPHSDQSTTQLAFLSARLPLLHVDARHVMDADELQKLMRPYLMQI